MPISDAELRSLRKYYSEIINGYSSLIHNKSKIIVKHFTQLDQSIIDDHHSIYLEEALSQGLLSEEEKLDQLNKDKEWTKSDDADLEMKRAQIIGLRKTIDAQTLPSQKKLLEPDLKTAENEYAEQLLKKRSLIGLTATSHANKKVNELYIYNSLYKSTDLKEKFYSEREYDELDFGELDRLIVAYNGIYGNFTDKTIKKISISPFLQNIYHLCADNPLTFYGKPIVGLTFFQLELFTYSRMFSKILSSPNIPDEVKEDPDDLYDYYTGNQKAKKIINSMENSDASSIMGATKEDLEFLGLTKKNNPLIQDTDDMFTAAKEKGGLNKEDLMRMMGV